jgi:hypothetical protein
VGARIADARAPGPCSATVAASTRSHIWSGVKVEVALHVGVAFGHERAAVGCRHMQHVEQRDHAGFEAVDRRLQIVGIAAEVLDILRRVLDLHHERKRPVRMLVCVC